MKIYKHGTTDPFKEYRVKCEECDCDFSYSLRDLIGGVTYDSSLAKLIPYRFIRCPDCFALYLHQEEEEAEEPTGNTEEPTDNPEIEDLDDPVDDEF